MSQVASSQVLHNKTVHQRIAQGEKSPFSRHQIRGSSKTKTNLAELNHSQERGGKTLKRNISGKQTLEDTPKQVIRSHKAGIKSIEYNRSFRTEEDEVVFA